MYKYFIEFEFETDLKNRYWLPLFIEANNGSEAKETKERIKTALEEL